MSHVGRPRPAEHTSRTGLILAVVVAFASLASRCPRDATPPPGFEKSGELDLATLTAQLSEAPGYFDTDNLISNESSYLQVADRLAGAVPPGGVYVGVGPEQNFSYIARVRPRYAFILDIRRENLLLHLLFAALFARANEPHDYLCLLFSRPCGPADPGAWAGADQALEALPPPSEQAFAANLRAAYEHVEGTLLFPLTAADREHVRKVYRAFFEEQASIRFRSFGRRGAWHPTYRALLRERSPSGRFGGFLETREDYHLVRDLSRGRRLVPVVGSFAGPHALRAIGAWTRAHGLVISAFYLSNVEFYLVREHGFPRFVENLRALPSAPETVLIRACFDYGRAHPAGRPEHRSVTLLQRLPRFLALQEGGAYRTDWDVCTVDYLP